MFQIPSTFKSWKQQKAAARLEKILLPPWDYFCSFQMMLWFLLEVYRMSNATAALRLASDQSNASVDDIEIYWCCGYTPYLSVFPVITRAQYRCRSEIPITACVSVINNRRRLHGRSQGGNGGSASMFNTRSAIHTSPDAHLSIGNQLRS